MPDQKSLKSVSPESVEQALSDALSKLLGCEYSVSIKKVDFSTQSLVGIAGVPMEIVAYPQFKSPLDDLLNK